MTTRAFIKKGDHIVLSPANELQSAHYKAFGAVVHEEHTDPNISVSSNIHLGEIPPELAREVRYWSVREQYEVNGSNSNLRAIGKYKHKGAIAQVETNNNQRNQLITVTGKNLGDCVELKDLILEGSIPPHAPYCVPQVKSRLIGLKEASVNFVEALFRTLDRVRN